MTMTTESVGEVQPRSEEEKKAEKMLEYVRSLRTIEDAMEPYRMWCADITEILLNNEEKNLSRLKIKEYALCHRDLKDYKQEFDWEMVALKKAKEKYPPRYKALYYRPEVKLALAA